MEQEAPQKQHLKDTFKRSLVKSITYRAIIIVLDFATVYLFTGKMELAIGFMLISNVYTTTVYFLYERAWDKIKWGKKVLIS